MRNYIERVYFDAYGSDGESGLFPYLRDLRTILNERKEQEAKRHQENKDRLDRLNMKSSWIVAIFTVVGVIVAGCAIVVCIMIAQHKIGLNLFPKMIDSPIPAVEAKELMPPKRAYDDPTWQPEVR